MKNKLIIFFIVLLLLSASLNVYQFMLEQPLPTVSDAIGVSETVDWYNAYRVGFLGVPVSLEDKKSNLKQGYQIFSAEIRPRNQDLTRLECQLVSAIVLNNFVTIDEPFHAQDEACQIISFDGTNKTAVLKTRGILFTITGNHVVWQDTGGSGPLVKVIDRLYHNERYR